MNKQEMNNIWRLIGTYRQGDQRLGDKRLLEAWYAAVWIYDAKDVERAVIGHFRDSSYFPDVNEITSRLPRPTQAERMKYADPGPAARAGMAASRKWQEEWHEELRGRGLPTFREAIAAGMEPGAWRKMLKEAEARE